ncbi:uncharacterized protein KRP23_3310 [Phytophthora ramorum]|uniref:uncharacterized protein n=1 Tax=Phytophthora ramorum TaxID=164328 RepID=UPI0030A8EE5E|nr:hypothetical protein KRP23_3310 [Phytophthora ramorum]
MAMENDEYCRKALEQCVATLERHVDSLSRYNNQLRAELRTSKQQVAALSQQNVLREAAELCTNNQQPTHWMLQSVTESKRKTERQAEARGASRYQTLTHEVAALKNHLHRKQDCWERYDRATKAERASLTKQLAAAKAKVMQMQSRADTAEASCNSFERRLQVVIQEKQNVEMQLAHYKKKLHGKSASMLACDAFFE